MRHRLLACGFEAAALLATVFAPMFAGAPDIVLYASDVTTMRGNWARVGGADAAGGQYLASVDKGWAAISAPLAVPTDFFEATFVANANTAYHVWLRLRASGDSKWNDSVWVQFSDARDANGALVAAIGSTSGLLVNLENCYGCGTAGWGWQDKAYWANPAATVRFATTGSRTLRVQTREDGVQVDQIVLSASTFLTSAPGQVANDRTIIARPAAGVAGSQPFQGTPAAIPGRIAAQDFDEGGEGVAYHDTAAGNSGGAYRSTDVDLEPSTDGGNDVGWIAAGEWLNYTVNVEAAGAYRVIFRVASLGPGGTFHLEMNGTDVSGPLTIPATGSWQAWQSVTAAVTLSAGRQIARLVMDSAGSSGAVGNITSMEFTPTPSAPPYTGTAAPIPGKIAAANFDNGGEGVAFHDATPGNAGGAYRATNVDLEASSDGGYDIGWIDPGEWVNYTVNVASAGSYTAQLRVASPNGGGALHIGFNGPSNVWTAVAVPATGSWRTWTTVTVPVTLGAGQQLMTLLFDTGGFNIASVNVTRTPASPPALAPPPPPPAPTPPATSSLRVMTWNIQSGNSLSHTYVLPSQVQFMVAQRADVVILQEVSIYNEDQPTKFRTLLQQATGQTWYASWAPACSSGGCLGNMILSRIPMVDTQMVGSGRMCMCM